MSDDTYLFGREIDGKLYVPFEDVRPMLNRRDDEIERLREALNGAYTERNRCVALLATVYPSGLKSTDIPGWDKEWHNCVYIDFPTGQGSWHFHDDDAHLFNHVGPYAGEWDGHTTDEKYERIARAALGEGKE